MRHRIKPDPRKSGSEVRAHIMRAIKSPQGRRLIYKREHEHLVFGHTKGINMIHRCRRSYAWAFGKYRWTLS